MYQIGTFILCGWSKGSDLQFFDQSHDEAYHVLDIKTKQAVDTTRFYTAAKQSG